MKKYYIALLAFTLFFSSCSDFLTLQPEYLINENSFYKNANDFETALIGTYSGLQGLHNASVLYLTELTTDNAEVQWSSPTIDEQECDEVRLTSSNSFANSVWSTCFTTISRCNNILQKMEGVTLSESLQSQYKGEALFLRAYCYFYLVRLYGNLPLIEKAFRSPNEIAQFDMTRKPVESIYQLIIKDLTDAAGLLDGVTGLSKSRASKGAAKTLLGKVYLTKKEYALAETVLKEVIDMKIYSLVPNYKSMFTNGNEGLPESIFEIEYLSGNVGEGNSFSSIFTPSRFDMGIFPGNMQGSGRIVPTPQVANAYEPGDLRRAVSVIDSVRLKDGTYAKNLYGLKFVDFTTGLSGDGGINFTSLRYADVLLMYAEVLNETTKTGEAHNYLKQVRARAGLTGPDGLNKEAFTLALEKERRVEFLLEGHRWFDLVRTGRLQTVMNKYFTDMGLKFSVADHELIMPIPQRERDINPQLEQNPNY